MISVSTHKIILGAALATGQHRQGIMHPITLLITAPPVPCQHQPKATQEGGHAMPYTGCWLQCKALQPCLAARGNAGIGSSKVPRGCSKRSCSHCPGRLAEVDVSDPCKAALGGVPVPVGGPARFGWRRQLEWVTDSNTRVLLHV